MGVFVGEVLVKMLAEGKWPWRYFGDGWNRFDFIIVTLGLLPFSAGAVTVLRLIRLLRVLKLVRRRSRAPSVPFPSHEALPGRTVRFAPSPSSASWSWASSRAWPPSDTSAYSSFSSVRPYPRLPAAAH